MDSRISPSTRIQYRATGSELALSAPGDCLAIVSGWAGLAADYNGSGRIVGLLLPGDRIGYLSNQLKAIALTPVALIAGAPALPDSVSEIQILLRQCLRLQLSGLERVKDFFSETYERLAAGGLASDGTFELPITNQQLSEILGMTPVHLSRILTDLRSRRRIRTQGRRVWMSQQIRTDVPEPRLDVACMLRPGGTKEPCPVFP